MSFVGMDPRSKDEDGERIPDTDPAPPPSMSSPGSSPTIAELLRRGEYAVLDDDGEYG
jgi:hypothetical protein